jgi:hypothetical protein
MVNPGLGQFCFILGKTRQEIEKWWCEEAEKNV